MCHLRMSRICRPRMVFIIFIIITLVILVNIILVNPYYNQKALHEEGEWDETNYFYYCYHICLFFIYLSMDL
jgi:hypothetical protein